MKKILILGANGATAREIIERLRQQDDVKLTLFLRHKTRVNDLRDDRADVFEGDVNNPDDLHAAVRGKDMVVSTIGGMDLDVKTRAVIAAMKACGVRRIIAISAGGIYDELPEPFNRWDLDMVGYTRPVNLAMAEALEQSSLDYTILRPVWLTDTPVAEFLLTKKGEMYKGTETSRVSIAAFVAGVAKNPDLHIKENLGISRAGTDGEKPMAYR
jgi:uncharacterized protein YbjT (DUF2867 family)